ncbi:MAG: DUF2784 domain-containing protein [Syntrophaceae bacterium]|nr:DUF2784 domain-containing protein [Syntrophaceae bacterium]
MGFKIVADLVVLIHFIWILFLFLGALWGLRNGAVKILHISGLLFAFLIQIFDWHCPLTHLEVWLRTKHDPAIAYTGSFIIHYVERIVYMEISRPVIVLFTILLCGMNVCLYFKKSQILKDLN